MAERNGSTQTLRCGECGQPLELGHDCLARPASGSRDGFYRECPDCGYDEENCVCDDPNYEDDRWLRDEEERERLREEEVYLYGI